MPVAPPTSRMTNAAAAGMRAAIRLAGGKEVCFVCGLDDRGVIHSARVVARGGIGSVLSLPGIAGRGEMLVHNHSSGELSPSDAHLGIAGRLNDDGVGFRIIDNMASSLDSIGAFPNPYHHHLLHLYSTNSHL